MLERVAEGQKELIQVFENIKCPLCENLIQYQRVNLETHAWICEECPFVGFEYYSPDDSNNMYDKLENI